jgi:hypothetical protein
MPWDKVRSGVVPGIEDAVISLQNQRVLRSNSIKTMVRKTQSEDSGCLIVSNTFFSAFQEMDHRPWPMAKDTPELVPLVDP